MCTWCLPCLDRKTRGMTESKYCYIDCVNPNYSTHFTLVVAQHGPTVSGSQVVLWGTSPILKKLAKTCSAPQRLRSLVSTCPFSQVSGYRLIDCWRICRKQLRRVRSFLKLQAAKVYKNRAGETKCAGNPSIIFRSGWGIRHQD